MGMLQRRSGAARGAPAGAPAKWCGEDGLLVGQGAHVGQTQTLSGLGGETALQFATRMFELGNGECNTGEQTDLRRITPISEAGPWGRPRL